MDKFIRVTGAAAPLMRINIDTEVVIPINRLIGHKRGELGPYCFEAWRYALDGGENSEFVLNQPRYREAKILLAGDNFGCGSSREHAVWSLADFGFRCIIAPSFGDIFYWNCFQNGVLPIRLPEDQVKELAAEVEAAVHELPQTQVLGERGRQEEPGISDQTVIVEGHIERLQRAVYRALKP